MTPICSREGCSTPAVEHPVLLLPPLPDGPPLQHHLINASVCAAHRPGITAESVKTAVSWDSVESSYADLYAKWGHGAPVPRISRDAVDVTWAPNESVGKTNWWQPHEPHARN